MPTECSRGLFGDEVVESRRVVTAFDGEDNTSDGGGLLLGASDRAIGLVARLAACFVDHRAAAQVEHTLAAIVAQRVFGLALGYEDLIDHHPLRRDPVLATLAGKLEAKRATPPHDHTTWAVVVGIEGEEVNRLWRRVDDGDAPSKAELEQVEETLVAPGTGVALMPDDIHSIHRASDAPLLHFHLYGRIIEPLPERKQFDLQRGTYRVYPANPSIQR